MKLFIKSQPDHLPDLPSVVSRWELPWQDRLAFEAALANFDATGNPVFAVRAFILATALGVYPPQRIMQWVSQAFQSWDEEQGKLPMDKAMGLGLPRGKPAVYPTALLQERNEVLMAEVDLLMALGASREKAAAMVESRLQEEDWNKSRYDLRDIKAKTIEVMHIEAKRDQRRLKEMIQDMKSDPDWRDWVRKQLRRYRPNSIAEELQSML